MKRIHEISMNDCQDGISVLLVIFGCSIKCDFCFNTEIWEYRNISFSPYKEIIDKHKRKINNFVLGGGDILDKKNQELTQNICNYLRDEGKKIHLQISAKSLQDSMDFLDGLPFDSVQLSLNDMCYSTIMNINSLYGMCDDIITRVVYLEDESKIEVPRNIKITELQIDYYSKGLYQKAKQYALDNNIQFLISKEYGREKL